MNAQRNREIAAIHVARQQLGLDETQYRELLEAWTGKTSATKLSQEERHLVLNHFRRMGFERRETPGRLVIEDDDKPQVKKIKALWLELHRLGKVESPTLAALNAYVNRMTKLSHVNWLTPAQAGRVTEAIKKWRDRKASSQAQGTSQGAARRGRKQKEVQP